VAAPRRWAGQMRGVDVRGFPAGTNLIWPNYTTDENFSLRCVSTMGLPGKPDCCWTATAPATAYAKLNHSGHTDVAIIGAGIVGLTAAYLLTQAGLSVAVLEARKIGRQVTGRSTAKITAQHTLIYRHLIETIGIDQARLYANANRKGVEQIRNWVDQLKINCDFEPKDAYAYTCDPACRAEIEAEADAARRLGFMADVLVKAPLPFETAGALRFRDQAQFNPAQYLTGLAKAVKATGGRIFENTRVTGIKLSRRWRIESGRNHLDAEHVISATNLPIGPVPFDQVTRPRCHIAMAFRSTSAQAIDGMFIGIDNPTHSLRMGRDREGPLFIVLGPSFPTGHDGDVAARFQDLENWVRRNLRTGDVAWRWVNEDYDTADRVPFAGAPSKEYPGLCIATGFNGWGISNGTAAGMLIADQIRGRKNPWTTLYDPARRTSKNFNKGGESQSLVSSLEDIRPGAGGVIKLGRGKIAVRKTANGLLRAFSASCTHMGCIVTWNNADQTWNCPCHGSIFSTDGDVVHGPATEALPARKLPSNWLRRRSHQRNVARRRRTRK
jgi:glycine/D-amino acid oxidase-like deaminating enzyme/nitrite reductase/ring-hydroxylating ferredoxin subunit